MFDGKFRAPVDRAVKPIGDSLQRTRLTPDHLTVVGVVVAVGAAVAIAVGQLHLGLALVILAALPDLFDGALAKASNTSSPRGAFFDSVVDRVTDALLFAGVAFHLIEHESPRLAMLPFGIMALSSVISYERIIALCVGLLFSTLLVPILWVMLVLTAVTAVQRFAKVWKQAAVAPIVAERIELRRSRRHSRRIVRTERRRTRIARPRKPDSIG